jgi:hypothetical protein
MIHTNLILVHHLEYVCLSVNEGCDKIISNVKDEFIPPDV